MPYFLNGSHSKLCSGDNDYDDFNNERNPYILLIQDIGITLKNHFRLNGKKFNKNYEVGSVDAMIHDNVMYLIDDKNEAVVYTVDRRNGAKLSKN